MKRFYQIYLDPNTGQMVAFDNDSNINSGRLTVSGSNVYTIEHSFGTNAILCFFYDDDGQPMLPDKVKISNINIVEVTVNTTREFTILIIS